MDTLDLFVGLRNTFREIDRQCERFAPSFRDGTAKATWLEDGVNYAFDSWRAQLLLRWLLSDDMHDLSLSDFDAGERALIEFGIISPTRTLADIQASATERDRTKLLAFFRADKADQSLNVGQGLNAVSTAMANAKATAMSLINTTGDATTIKYIQVDGITRKEGKTLSEMGIDGSGLANELDALRTAISGVVKV